MKIETPYEQVYQPKIDKRSTEEIYESIVGRIRRMYQGKLSELEIHEAARNMIEFVKIFMQVQGKLEKEKNSKT